MDKFLETHNLTRLDGEKVETLNRPILNSAIEPVIKNLPKGKEYLYNKESISTNGQNSQLALNDKYQH